MNAYYLKCVEDLNNDDVSIRLESLKKLMQGVDGGEIERPENGNDVNNHIHTTYSFSPYSPSKALWMAFNAGLTTAGIMDHDSISGACEFIDAGKITGIATTIGVECRADFSGTPLNGKRINNPDQKSLAYTALHGIPHTKIDRVRRFFIPYNKERNIRDSLMASKINGILKPYGIKIDFDRDVVPLSKSSEGGSITERHILFALSRMLIEMFGKGKGLLVFLKSNLNLNIPLKLEKYLLDSANEYYEYDLLGILKSEMASAFYIDASAECPGIRDVIDLSNEIGAISAYAYLGDVVDSVTGDKKSRKFEDDYIGQLFEVIKEFGFNAVTYMPSRNTPGQLKKIKALCERYGFLQISGEDINSPRQSFVCAALKNEKFENLIDSTWALIGHEMASTQDIDNGMFSRDTIIKYPDLDDRIKIFKEIGKKYSRFK